MLFKTKILSIVLLCLFTSCKTKSKTNVQEEQNHLPEKVKYTVLEQQLLQNGFVDLKTVSNDFKIELGYTKADNFTNKVLYDSLQHAFLHPLAAEKLKIAQGFLQQKKPNYTFFIFDALRPRSVQTKMWNVVKNTPQQKYVANPRRGSIHNFGFAVDLSIYDKETQQLIDLGTKIDHLGIEAEYRHNQMLAKQGKITKKAVQNRQLLRSVMVKAGFQPINSEWWHFNAISKEKARKEYKIVE